MEQGSEQFDAAGMNPHGAQPNKRLTARLACEELISNLGQVVDLSREGCRIIQGRFGGVPVGARLTLRLEGYEGGVSVPAEVMRRRPRGPFKLELGIRFLALSAEQQNAISALARTHRVRYAIIRDAA